MTCGLQDGKAFLEKNLTEWKKPGLLGHFGDEDGAGASAGPKGGAKGKKGAAAKVNAGRILRIFMDFTNFPIFPRLHKSVGLHA